MNNDSPQYEISVKEFERDDFDRLMELDNLCFPEYMQFTYLKLRDILSNDNSVVFTAKDEDGYLIGYILLFLKKFDHEMLIISLCVDPEYQRQNIGTMLLEFVISFGNHMRLDKVILQVEEKNEGAVKLFESEGFKKSEEIADYFEENNKALEMIYDYTLAH